MRTVIFVCMCVCVGVFGIHSRTSCCDHSCKRKGGRHPFGGGFHALFILVDSDAFGAYWFSFHRVKGLAFDGNLALLTDEAIGMPLCVERGDIVLHDGFAAAAALWREHVEVIVAAVRFAVPFVEPVFTELLATLGAEEVLRMPGLLESCHAFIKDGTVAVGTSRGEEVVVVRLAVGAAVALEEVPGSELLSAVGAREVLRMPRPAERRDHLSDDGFLAGVAASLLRGLDSLAAHVCPEGSEHMLERGGFGLPRAAAVVLLPRAFLPVNVGSAFAACTAHLEVREARHQII